METLVCLILLGMTAFSVQRSTPKDPYYVAAVLEYHCQSDTDTNLRSYLDFIRQAAEKEADIVVFPEMTLTRGTAHAVPARCLLAEHPIPALAPDLYDHVLVQLSLAAREHEIYVLVNVQEAMDCRTSPPPAGEDCPARLLYRFNTNVVFDRSGAVIDRYRKINLYGEYSRTSSLDSGLGVFSTDFGVTFGHFICFDLMFQVPALQVIQKMNVSDVVFSTMWFSEMPFLTAVEIQQAYAYATNVNLLASGANNVAQGSAGSGIYSGKAGALVSTMPGVTTRKMLVSKVPKLPGQVLGIDYPGALPTDPKTQDSLLLKRDVSLAAHVTRPLEESEQLQRFSLSDGHVSCRFRVRLSDSGGAGEKVYRYRATAFDGVRTFDGLASAGSRVCSVVACSSSDVNSCSVRFAEYTENSTRRFSELSISATVPTPTLNETLQTQDATYMFTSLDTSIMPLAVKHYSYTSVLGADGRTVHTLELTSAQAELLAFAVWGRVFPRDGHTPTEPKQ